MKSLFVALFALTLTTVAVAQKNTANEVVRFTETKYDFGKIKQGSPVTHDFEFQNVSAKPVVIESANASCGCTTPSWPKTPVTKSKSDKISAGFNAAAPGPFDKTIYVKVSGVEQPLELKITGEVLSADDFAKYVASKPKKK